MTRMITYAAAIHEALSHALKHDPKVYVMGLGVPDPSGVFGTTRGLAESFGSDRVFDMPISENAMTGVVLGSALTGMRPVLVHMRLEFAIPSMDQICNQAAKWHYMFGGQATAPITIRMIVGRGWGQGPQHSQSLHAWFSHIPGLKVVMPSTPRDAKGLLISSIFDDAPVVFIEHRWLYNIHGDVPAEEFEEPLGVPKRVRTGDDVTIIGSSYATLDATRAADQLTEQGIGADVIDIRTLNPLDDTLILESVRKTGRIVAVDQGVMTAGYAGEIIARVCEQAMGDLKAPPVRVTLPDSPTPTTRALSNYYYPTIAHITSAVCKMLNRPHDDPLSDVDPEDLLDIPDATFKGPF